MWNPHRGGRCPRLLWLVLLVGGLCTATAPAAPSTPPAGEQLEVSMLLRGALDVSASGAVEALHLGDERQVPPVVAGFVRRAVAGWRFDPYLQEGQPRAIRIPLILRVVGTPLDDGNLQIALRSASFQNYDPNDPTRLTWQNAAPPLYPGGAGMFGVNGDAYVLMRVGRDGRVQDAIVEQVNMRVRASPRRLAAYRKQFSRNALVAARTWSFRVPTEANPGMRRTGWCGWACVMTSRAKANSSHAGIPTCRVRATAPRGPIRPRCCWPPTPRMRCLPMAACTRPASADRCCVRRWAAAEAAAEPQAPRPSGCTTVRSRPCSLAMYSALSARRRACSGSSWKVG